MHHGELASLYRYLLDATPTAKDLSKFLYLDTFTALAPSALFISEVQESGKVRIKAGFGSVSNGYEGISAFPLSTINPFTDSIRSREVMQGGLEGVRENSGINLQELQEEAANLAPQQPWKFYLSSPIERLGSLTLFFSTDVELRSNDLELIESVCSMLALRFRRADRISAGANEQESQSDYSVLLNRLTKRQKAIFNLVKESKTNQEISRTIGYSESLVRQELVKIFRVFSVKTRGELRGLEIESTENA